jgi:hypothetical protein
MTFFTLSEFKSKYTEYSDIEIPTYYIEASCEMIFSQIGLRFRDTSWDETSVPSSIKNASMEQLRFMLEHDIPFVDSQDIKAGSMESHLNSDYSTLALRILANNGYIYRGSPINYNMGLNIPFGD